MRLVAMLVALLIVGLLVYKQLGQTSGDPAQDIQAGDSPMIPKVPTTPGEVNKFDAQMNDYLKQEAAKRDEAIREAESR